MCGRSGRPRGMNFGAMKMKSNNHRQTKTAAVALLAAVLAGGCSSGSASIGRDGVSYLGARDVTATTSAPASATSNVTAGTVLSAIVFERVTGLEIDPARLVER